MNRFSEYTQTAIEIAKKAAALLKSGFDVAHTIKEKAGIHNIVTEYDIKSEKLIISSIRERYPNHNILSEEDGESIKKDHQIKWIVDPLDGTVNYAHRIPVFCVSIAVEQNSEIILGVILNPMTNELFVAEKDRGAYLNGKKISVSKTDQIDNAFLATGFPYNLKDNPDKCIDRFLDILKLGLPIRRLGSAALDLAYTADGRFDAYWETTLGPWDCAAGQLLIEEAGGKVSNWKGEPFKISASNNIVATNGKIHNEFISFLNKI